MIKLKDILEEISNESKEKLLKEGSYDHTISFDGEEILALSREADEIEVDLSIDYSADGGDISIEGWDIMNITIYGEDGNERDVDLRFLHPQQEKLINSAIYKYINAHEKKIKDSIYSDRESEH